MENVQRLEVHYYLQDGAHSMNAFIRNKCEAETLAAFSYIAAQLGFDVLLETAVHTEGGLKETWAFILKPESTPILVTLLIALLNMVVTIWNAPPWPDKELELAQKELAQLSIQEKRLSNQKLSMELDRIKTEALAPIPAVPAPAKDRRTKPPPAAVPRVLSLHTDPKVTTRRSNFYRQLLPYAKVTGVGFGWLPNDPKVPFEEQYVPRSDFSKFIIKTDKLPSQSVEAVIEIVAPVIKEGNIHWKGAWAGEPISFAMNDKAFKDMVMRREVSFQHGNCISCILQIDRKLDEAGDEKVVGYAVTMVLSKIDGETATEMPKGKVKRFYDMHVDGQAGLFPEQPGN